MHICVCGFGGMQGRAFGARAAEDSLGWLSGGGCTLMSSGRGGALEWGFGSQKLRRVRSAV